MAPARFAPSEGVAGLVAGLVPATSHLMYFSRFFVFIRIMVMLIVSSQCMHDHADAVSLGYDRISGACMPRTAAQWCKTLVILTLFVHACRLLHFKLAPRLCWELLGAASTKRICRPVRPLLRTMLCMKLGYPHNSLSLCIVWASWHCYASLPTIYTYLGLGLQRVWVGLGEAWATFLPYLGSSTGNVYRNEDGPSGPFSA